MSDVVQQIEISMEQVKEKIAKAELLERLSKNPDFKEFILKGFCEDHALGLLAKKVSPGFSGDADQAYIKGQLTAVGHLQLWMRFIKQEGELAKESLRVAEEERARALEDEA